MDNETNGRRARRGRPYWEAQIKNWQRSGLTQTEYCRREGIVPQYFTNWKSRLKQRPATDRFVELPALVSPATIAHGPTPLVEFRIDEDLGVCFFLRLPGFPRDAFGGGA
jgi:hypothetical protein